MKVFDTSAVIAILFGEKGAAQAQAALPGAMISLVNVTETIDDFIRRGRKQDEAIAALSLLQLGAVAPDQDQAHRAASLKPIQGLSLGDRYCIALAQSLGVPVVTSDQAWGVAPLGIEVELIR
jgi:PIN domain nuclease of toxin-antitoxin system